MLSPEDKKIIEIAGVNTNSVELDKIVENKEAFEEWKSLMKSPVLKDNFKIVKCSDGNIVNIGSPNVRKDKLQHLPEAERESILKKKSVYHRTYNKAIAIRRRAFGLVSSKNKNAKKADNNVLLKFKKEELIELFGRLFSPEEVRKIAVEEWKMPMTLSDLVLFQKEYYDVIKAKQDDYKKSYSDVRLGEKRSRLEELAWMYGKMKDKFSNATHRDDARVMKEILRDIKGEVEGNEIKITGKIGVDMTVQQGVNQHVQREMLNQMIVRQITIMRVAIKMEVNPYLLMERLTKSYYAQIFEKDNKQIAADDVEVEDLKGHYDFDKIEKQNKELVADEVEFVEVKDKEMKKTTKSVDGEERSEVKDKLLKFVAKEKETIRFVQDEIRAKEYSKKVSVSPTIMKPKVKLKKKQ